MEPGCVDNSRRQCISKLLKATVGILGVVGAIPFIGFFISPSLKKGEGTWVPIGDMSLIKDNEPSKVTYLYSRKDGWEVAQVRKTVFVRSLGNGKVAVLSNRCTHLGCAVDWSSTSGQFTCPCHGGTFDKDGKVLSGPPPKPLALMQAKVENNKIYVLEI